MDSVFDVRPEEPRTGVPLTVAVPLSQLGGDTDVLTVVPERSIPLDSFTVPTVTDSGMVRAQFVVTLPGKYEMALGGKTAWLQVNIQRNIPFAVEVGFLAAAVSLVLGGIIVWASLRRRKTKAI